MENCKLGITNAKEIEKVKDVFTIMIENLNKRFDNLGTTMDKQFRDITQKIDSVNKNLTSKIDSVDKNLTQKIDNVEGKFTEMKKKLPEQMDETVKAKMKTGVYSFVKWVSISIGGVAIATIVGWFIKGLLG